MSKEEINLNMEEVYVFPHVRYIPLDGNPNSIYVYKKYVGNHKSLTKGKVYEFHQAMFSPNNETPRKKVWITKTDIRPYIRYEDTRNKWVDVRKPK